MKTIHKHELLVESEFEINSFTYFIPLTVQVQRGVITLWAEVDTKSPEKSQKIFCYGTGHEIDETGLQYIGSAQVSGYVWHYYFKTTQQ